MLKFDHEKLHPRDQFKLDTENMWKNDRDLKLETCSDDELWKDNRHKKLDKTYAQP